MSGEGKKTPNVRYALILAFYWSNYAILLNYANVYLLDKGFRATSIGVMIAVSAGLAAVLQPLIGAYADREKSLSVKSILLVMTLLFLLFNAIIPASAGNSALLLMIAFSASITLMQAMAPLANALGTLSTYGGEKVNFGVARGVGSFVYAVISLLLGRFTQQYGNAPVPFLAFTAYTLFFVTIFVFPFRKAKTEQRQTKRSGFFGRYPRFPVILLANVCLYTGHMLLNTFMFQVVSAKGGNNTSLGISFAIAAMVELPVMAAFALLLKRISSGGWLMICGLGFVVKSTASLLAPNVGWFYVSQFLQLSAYALLAVAAVYYVDSIMAPEDAVKGQAFFTMTNTVGTMCASALGGVLLDTMGVRTLLVFVLGFSVTGALLMVFGVKTYRPGRV